MQTADMHDKDYEECVTIIRDKTINRMKFIWEVELDKVYDEAKMMDGAVTRIAVAQTSCL